MIEDETTESIIWISEFIASAMNYLLVILVTYMFFMSVPIIKFWHKIGLCWVLMAYCCLEVYSFLSNEMDNPELRKMFDGFKDIKPLIYLI